MKYKTTSFAKRFTVLSLVLFPAGASFAAIDKFDPYAFIGAAYDSNVFRTPDNEEDDTAAHFGAGFESDLKLSRQHILLNAVLDRAEYDNFSELDHTRKDAGAAWRWQVGNLWSGNLGYRYTDELSSFDQFTTRVKDIKTTHRADFEAGYQIHPDFELLGGVGFSEVSYDERERLDRESNSRSLEVQYRNTRRTRIGVRGRIKDTDFKNKELINGSLVSNDYSETEISAVFYWEGTGKSSLEARLGYTDLKYDELDDRDFNGSTGRLTHQWLITGKTRLNTSIWRETDSQYDEINTYVLSKGISISPVWSATAKITVRGDVSYINDDYKADDIVFGGQRRDDDTWLYAIGVNYTPTTNVSLSLGYSKENRDSSENFADFDDQRVNGEVRVRF